jgi:hypothetical protein
MNAEMFGTWVASAAAAGTWVGPFSALLAAFVFGQALAWVYERTYVGLSYSRGFSHTLVLVCVAASVLVLAMNHSIVAGIGLFGVLSMIRFRTDLKTSRDLVFVMGAAALGVSSGVEAWMVGILGTLAFAGIALYLATGPFGSRKRFDGVLRFHIEPGDERESAVRQLLSDFCRRSVLLSTVDIDSGQLSEHMYQVKFFDPNESSKLLKGLRDEARAKETRLMLQDSTSEY